MAKIAILSFYSGVVERGVETFAFEIAKRISENHDVFVFQAGRGKVSKFKVVELRTSASIPRSSRGLLGKVYLDIQSCRIFLLTLKVLPRLFRGKFDLVIPLNGGWQMFAVRIFSILTGTKVLVSGHAGIGSDDAWNLLLRPDVFVALTSEEEKWAKRLVPEVKTVVIHNGVDLARFNPQIQPRKLNLTRPIVICVSALVPYKRVDLIVRAVARTQMSLLVLGDGEERGHIDSLGKRLLGSRYLRQVVPYDEIPSYYKSADVFTSASKTEAFGISYVEAMACNLPVVTTSDKSRAEIIGDAGILTNPTDINKYAKDLTIASKANYRNKPYNQSLKFSWNKVGEKYLTLIDEIIA